MDNLHSGGIIENPGNQPPITSSGCDYIIPRSHPSFERFFGYLDAMADPTPCPYCTQPEGWDACPVHRDGTPE